MRTAQQYVEQLEELLEWAAAASFPGRSCLSSLDLEFFCSSLMFTDMRMRSCKAG